MQITGQQSASRPGDVSKALTDLLGLVTCMAWANKVLVALLFLVLDCGCRQPTAEAKAKQNENSTAAVPASKRDNNTGGSFGEGSKPEVNLQCKHCLPKPAPFR